MIMHAMHVAARYRAEYNMGLHCTICTCVIGSLCGEFPPVKLSVYRSARFSSLELRSVSSKYFSTCVDENLLDRNWTRFRCGHVRFGIGSQHAYIRAWTTSEEIRARRQDEGKCFFFQLDSVDFFEHNIKNLVGLMKLKVIKITVELDLT